MEGGVSHSKSEYQRAIELGFFFQGANLHINTMLKGLKKQLRGHQEAKANNIYTKKRGAHKRQVSHES